MGNLYSSEPHFLHLCGDNVRFMGCLEDSHCTSMCILLCIHIYMLQVDLVTNS